MKINDLKIMAGNIKGTGGGSKVKILRWTYVVALVMGSQELFTESKNFALVLRYDSSKLATTRAISRIWLYLYREFA